MDDKEPESVLKISARGIASHESDPSSAKEVGEFRDKERGKMSFCRLFKIKTQQRI